ncbi:pseudouridylate synthase RPUSD2-like isoform X2 [Haematobia irritans]|uniref:pseudouridylate synthase RPUSD2-like isoform X2 n=1 Tax=Haematobia irritans TaxID=7368 RepID=UPI003F504606
MQYPTGSWYLPWGVPVQKMITLPYAQPASASVDTYISSSSAACHVLSNPHQGHGNANITNPIQMQTTTGVAGYQQGSYNTHLVGKYACGNTVESLSLNTRTPSFQHMTAPFSSTMLNNHARTMLPNTQIRNEHSQHPNMLMPSTLYTSLTLPTYALSSSTPAAGITSSVPGMPGNQNSLANSNQLISQQQPGHNTISTSPLACISPTTSSNQAMKTSLNLDVNVVAMRRHVNELNVANKLPMTLTKIFSDFDDNTEKKKVQNPEKRKVGDSDQLKDLKKAKLETKALKAKRPGFTDERYHETSYYIENGLRKVYPYYFTFTTFTKGRWVGEKILDVFSREFRAHPAEEYERCIKAGSLTVNYEKVPVDYKLKHNDLLANVVHRHEVPVTSEPITIVHMDDDIVVVNKPASIPVHPCGRYRHNTVVFILAKEYNLKNLRTIHRLDRLTSGLLLFGRSPKKARQLEHQIRNRQVQKEYVCRVEGNFPEGILECDEPIEVVSYKIGVCKVSPNGKECKTTFQKLSHDGQTSVVLCKPLTGRMHQIRVHLQYLGFPVANDPLYNHEVFGPVKGRAGDIGGKTDEELVRDLINIHNAENWLGIDSDSEMSFFKPSRGECDIDTELLSQETSRKYSNSPTAVDVLQENASNCSIGNSNKDTKTESFNNENNAKATVATQTDQETADLVFNPEKLAIDKHCYECKVRYRDPKAEDLVMYLHAWKYKVLKL